MVRFQVHHPQPFCVYLAKWVHDGLVERQDLGSVTELTVEMEKSVTGMTDKLARMRGEVVRIAGMPAVVMMGDMTETMTRMRHWTAWDLQNHWPITKLICIIFSESQHVRILRPTLKFQWCAQCGMS